VVSGRIVLCPAATVLTVAVSMTIGMKMITSNVEAIIGAVASEKRDDLRQLSIVRSKAACCSRLWLFISPFTYFLTYLMVL